MKRAFCYFFLAVMFLAPQVLSNSKPVKNNDINQITTDVMLIGNINVRSAKNGNIVLIVDSGISGQPDGVPDLVVRFAPRKIKAKYRNLSYDLQSARLFLESRRVAVIGSDGQTWISLSLEPVKSNDPSYGLYGDSSFDLAQTVRISKGHALQRQSVYPLKDGSLPDFDIEMDIFIKISKGMRLMDDDIGIEGDLCSSGGPGATQCGVGCGTNGSCTVTCEMGTYACCNCGSPPSCKCKGVF